MIKEKHKGFIRTLKTTEEEENEKYDLALFERKSGIGNNHPLIEVHDDEL